MNISDYLRNALLNHALGVATYTPPSHVWAALYTVAPTNTGGGVEVSAPDYTRTQSSWAAAASGSIATSADLLFPYTGGTTQFAWGTVAALGLLDAPGGGNLLFYGPLSAPVTLNAGTAFEIVTGTLTVSLG